MTVDPALARLRERILAASPPAPQDSEAWIGLWTPELGKPDTGILVRDVDLLPAWVAEHVRDLVLQARVRAAEGQRVPFCLTAGGLDTVPPALAPLVETVVAVPPLRERVGDVVPLAHHVAHRVRGREVTITLPAIVEKGASAKPRLSVSDFIAMRRARSEK